METGIESTKGILASIADKLLEAQQEIDELAVQLALGKAEAMDKFIDVKNDFRESVRELKNFFATVQLDVEDSAISAKIDELERSLNESQVRTRAAFDIQKENLLKIISSLERALKKKNILAEELQRFNLEVQKFKLKLEILRLKLTLKKLEVRNDFRVRMEHARNHINELRTSINEKVEAGKDRYEDFRDEIRLTYTHLKKALKGL
ncbi:MAG TPA: hypothetical protein VFW11_08785 [Cyclobacteriaceae bacterium]|nr:hypothetical protein [Cyclobacteriaceae bacterium]